MQLLLRRGRTSSIRCLCQRCAVGPSIGHAVVTTPAASLRQQAMAAEGSRPLSGAAAGGAQPQMSEQETQIAEKLRAGLESPVDVSVTVRYPACITTHALPSLLDTR